MDLIKTMEKCMPYLDEKERLKTFTSWVFKSNVPCSVEKMAEAGFIFIGNKHEKDSVKCFLCDKHLDGWESSDNPWKEHLKHASYCKFAKFQTAQDNVTVEQLLDLRLTYLMKILDNYTEAKDSDLNSLTKSIEKQLKK